MTKIIRFFLLSCLFVSPAWAEDDNRPYMIPRSTVIPLVDTISGRHYELYIKLPRSYSEGSKLPVVYMTDALTNFQTLSGAAEYPMNSGEIEPLILVGISWEKEQSPAWSRQRDYTPTVDSSWKTPTGEADRHMAFIRDRVIPFVETYYNTDPERRTYYGYSLGGLLGGYILLSEPDTFKNYILGSPSFWYDNEVIFKLESSFAEKRRKMEANVFISIGEYETPAVSEMKNDMVEQAKRFHARLGSRSYPGLSQKFMVINSANHAMAQSSAGIQGLYWLFKKITTVPD